MNLDQIYDWILKHPNNYPGLHQKSQARTNSSYKPLEPKAQFHIIFQATSEYIKEKMLEGKGVNLKNFGAFSFEVVSDLVKPAQQSNIDITQQLDVQLAERKHVHKIRPCFVPDSQLKVTLLRYSGKEELSAPKSQHSIYQKGFGMIYCNPVPIASACYLGKDIVKSAHDTFIRAVQDLISLNYDLRIDLGFLRLALYGKSLKYAYEKGFINTMNMRTFEQKMRKSDLPTSEHWQTTYDQKWARSSLNYLLKRPNNQIVKQNFEKTLALKIMSLDLNTAEITKYSKSNLKLPVILNNKKK